MQKSEKLFDMPGLQDYSEVSVENEQIRASIKTYTDYEPHQEPKKTESKIPGEDAGSNCENHTKRYKQPLLFRRSHPLV